MVGRKRGRPVIESGKTERITCRLTTEEMELLEYLCEKTGGSKTEIIVNALHIFKNLVVDRN